MTTARSSRAATASCRTATRRSIRSRSSSNKNLLYTAQSIADIARASSKTPIDVAESLLRARQILFDVRELRPRPQLDDKVLTAWNGLMIAAFARASRVLGGGALGAGERRRIRRVGAPAERDRRGLVHSRHDVERAEPARLLRRYRAGDAAIDGYAEDYAYLIFGVLELFQASGDPQWLAWARELQARQDELFWDAAERRLVQHDRAPIHRCCVRMKEDYDGAEPSPTSVSAMNLLTLAHLTGERAYADRAAEAIASFGGRLEEQGRAVPFMAAALSTSHRGRRADRDHRSAGCGGHSRAVDGGASRSTGRSAVITRVDPCGSSGAGRAHAVDRGDEDDRRQGDGVCVPRTSRAMRRPLIRSCLHERAR